MKEISLSNNYYYLSEGTKDRLLNTQLYIQLFFESLSKIDRLFFARLAEMVYATASKAVGEFSLKVQVLYFAYFLNAVIAQLVESHPSKVVVTSSRLVYCYMGRYSRGQKGQTVNLLANVFEGSNPSLPIFREYSMVGIMRQVKALNAA